MEWYVEPGLLSAATELRRQVRIHLERHGEDGADLHAAEVIVAELVSNAVRHATGPVWASLTWTGDEPLFEVRDLGAGFDPRAELPADALTVGGRGLYLVEHLSLGFEVRERPGGGSLVSARLPVRRSPAAPALPRQRSRALPTLDEALPGGGFGKESFLRALVVQLAQAAEELHGPAAAEAAVVQVGTDVGGQMEEEFRRARALFGRLTPEQVAECYVRLKAAIDGDFRVVALDERRIELVNSRCPFGDVVQRAPSLCRMTSSVFGGIAARNSEGEALVELQERIAVGDPVCRVVVWLQPPDPAPPAAHRYRTPVEADR